MSKGWPPARDWSDASGLPWQRALSTSLAPDSTAADIAAAARQGDVLAQELFRTAGEGVGRGIASTAALLDLELVVIGGSIALRAWDLLGPPLEAGAAPKRAARLYARRAGRRAKLGDNAGLLGAAVLAFDSLDEA